MKVASGFGIEFVAISIFLSYGWIGLELFLLFWSRVFSNQHPGKLLEIDPNQLDPTSPACVAGLVGGVEIPLLCCGGRRQIGDAITAFAGGHDLNFGRNGSP